VIRCLLDSVASQVHHDEIPRRSAVVVGHASGATRISMNLAATATAARATFRESTLPACLLLVIIQLDVEAR